MSRYASPSRARPHAATPGRVVVVCLIAAVIVPLVTACHEEKGIKVASLQIEGAKAVDVKSLKAALATKASSRLPWGEKHYFDRAAFEADLKRMVAYYADRGYPDARVESFKAEMAPDKQSIRLKIVVREGEPVWTEDVQLWGFESVPQQHVEELKQHLDLKPGQVLDRARAKNMQVVAAGELHDHGYPYARVELLESEGSKPRHAIVTLAADPGIRANFGPVEIRGNRSVSDDVIRRTLAFRPGEMFAISQIQRTQRRLNDLDLFQFVNVEPRLGEQPRPEVPIRITVAESKHRQVQLSVGYGTEEKARGEASWKHVNFLGGARTAGIEGKWSALDRGLRANFNQPYLFSPDVSLAASGQRWFADEPAFQLLTRGARLTVTRQTSNRNPTTRRAGVWAISGSLVSEFEHFEISREALEDLSFRDELIALGLDPRTGTGRGTLTALALDFRRSTTESVLDNRTGYVANLHLEKAGGFLPGDFTYYETSVEGRHYWSLGSFAVWANRVRLASIDSGGPLSASVPFFKRYFLGGSDTLRGWGRFEVSPLSGAGLPIGGHSLFLLSTELRVPVLRNVGAVAFVDAGNVWTDSWAFRLGDLRYAVGPGLRYLTPIGPMRFDIGYQVNPIPGLLIDGDLQKRRWRMHFSIGHAF